MATGLFRKPGDPFPKKNPRISFFAANPKPGETVLWGQTPQSSTTVYGKGAIVFGIPFFGMGAFIVLLSAGVIHLKESSSDAPPWLLGIFGVIFGLPGLWLIMRGIRGILADRRSAEMLTRNPDEPWRADYNWDENGIGDQQKRGLMQLFGGMLFMFLFVAPFNYIAFQAGQNESKWGYLFAGVDFFAAIYAAVFVYRLMRWIKYGTGQLKFRRFPFYLGEKLDIDYVPARKLLNIQKVTCTLRCIREAYETYRSANRNEQRVVCYEVFKDSKEIDGATLADAYDGSVPLSFALPAERPATCLSDHPPIYWELEVSAETSGVNLNSRFLVPVYSRAGSLSIASNAGKKDELPNRSTTAAPSWTGRRNAAREPQAVGVFSDDQSN